MHVHDIVCKKIGDLVIADESVSISCVCVADGYDILTLLNLNFSDILLHLVGSKTT